MYVYKFITTSVYDGDTINGVVDLGFNTRMDIKVRLGRIDTPEIRTKDLEEKERGYAARDKLREIVDMYKDHLLIKTTKRGKYGRWIGELLLIADNHAFDEIYKYADEGEEYININDILVTEGYAVYREY